jgi:hypothetical protein
MADGKPSFISSTLSGISGSLKGMLTGGGVGAIMGAVVGGIIGGLATGGAGIGVGAIVGAELLGITMGAIGALSGTVTAVVASREAAQPTASDMVNVAKIAYAQGVSVGKQMEQEQSKEAESTKWRDRHAQEQASKAIASADGHTIH